MKYLLLLLAIFAVLSTSYCKKKTKCEVVRTLRRHGVPNKDLRNWLCLVYHESRFHYDAINHQNADGSKDHGIFQLNSRYFCDRPQGTSESTCWKVNTYGCADSCASFRNRDINNDASCAVRIQRCGGFKKWVAWRKHCSNVSSPQYSYRGC